ncbi:MAG: helix-turn-helix domain-containing protein [Chitinophagia bacterium]|jgi:HTH-type transcriptional regulator/antitoxin HigA|nr:helix-turn-helix domain-containing protein [Chitinophagia bacterium]
MNATVTKKEFDMAEKKMLALLDLATQKGGFNKLSTKQTASLEKYTQIVRAYEDANLIIPMPQTLQGLIELKMYEKKLKQKELAKLLNTTDTKLSEIMHFKRKPSLSFIKAMNEVLGIDGNLLLKIA